MSSGASSIDAGKSETHDHPRVSTRHLAEGYINAIQERIASVGALEHIRPGEVERMGSHARSLVESIYSPAACYQRLMGIFSSVCRNGDRRSVEPGR